MTRPGVVLVVDDEEMIAQALGMVLSMDHQVFVETSAASALERVARGERFDAIVCDVTMPKMNGPELYEALVARGSDLAERVVFMTGGVADARVRARLVASGRPCIDKPIDVDRLTAIVADLVVSEDRRATAARR